MNTLGERLKWAMKELRLSEPKAAVLAGVSKQAINKMVSGETHSAKWLFGLAEKMEINYNWLLKGDGEIWVKGKPTITTKSQDPAVLELIKQVNFLQNQLQKKDEQIEKKDELISLLSNKFLKLEATGFKPLNGGGAKTVEMYPQEEYTQLTGTNN